MKLAGSVGLEPTKQSFGDFAPPCGLPIFIPVQISVSCGSREDLFNRIKEYAIWHIRIG